MVVGGGGDDVDHVPVPMLTIAIADISCLRQTGIERRETANLARARRKGTQ